MGRYRTSLDCFVLLLTLPTIGDMAMAKDGTFSDFQAALEWARTNAADYVWPFQRWRIVPQGKRYALGVFNVNNGKQEGFIHA